jgi:hypothetical protein
MIPGNGICLGIRKWMIQSLPGFITLPKAVQRIATYVSDALQVSAKIDFLKRLQAVAAIQQ